MKTKLLLSVALALVLVLMFLGGCTPGTNQLKDTPNEQLAVAGFWRGLWQGFISPFVFLISLFKSDLNIYEVHNNGGWYNFGYLLGVACIFGGGDQGRRRLPNRQSRKG
jgi:hypothetical protein